MPFFSWTRTPTSFLRRIFRARGWWTTRTPALGLLSFEHAGDGGTSKSWLNTGGRSAPALLSPNHSDFSVTGSGSVVGFRGREKKSCQSQPTAIMMRKVAGSMRRWSASAETAP